jgi:integrase
MRKREGRSALHETMISQEVLREIGSHLPPLPSLVRYFDEYEETLKTFDPRSHDWKIETNGRVRWIRFGNIPENYILILKNYAIREIHKNSTTGSYYIYVIILTFDVQSKLIDLACRGSASAIDYLKTDFRSGSRNSDHQGWYTVGKSLLYYFCDVGFLGWSPGFVEVLRTIPDPTKNVRHRSVLDGTSIMSFEEEQKIVQYFDDLSRTIDCGNFNPLKVEEFRNASILYWNFAHAMRPVQIANRNIGHVRIVKDENNRSIVHVSFNYAKQRKLDRLKNQIRKMKRSWSPVFELWISSRDIAKISLDFDREDSLFGVSPQDISHIIARLTEDLTGIRRVPYDLRHTAAQRKADVGCSRVELAEFLMHSSIETSAAYIVMSPTQAEKINRALGHSPLMQALDAALKARSIDIDELLRLPADQQIGGAPHGRLIAGIGGCSLGQSFCTRTPALACYSCHKFMYLRDASVHEAARDSVREIVAEFIDERTNPNSPAYAQLTGVIESIDAIITDLSSEAGREH